MSISRNFSFIIIVSFVLVIVFKYDSMTYDRNSDSVIFIFAVKTEFLIELVFNFKVTSCRVIYSSLKFTSIFDFQVEKSLKGASGT